MEQTVKPRSGKTSSGRRERRFFRQYQRLEIVLLVSLVSFGIARPSSAAIEFAPVAPLAGTQASTDGDTNDYSPDIKTDGTGTWLAVWPQGPGGGLGSTGASSARGGRQLLGRRSGHCDGPPRQVARRVGEESG